MLHWTIKEPIIAPGVFDEMETSQALFYDGYFYVFFSVTKKELNGESSNKKGMPAGLYCYYGKNLQELKPVNEDGLVLNYGKFLFSVQLIKNAKTIKNRKKIFLAIGWLNYDDADNFVGKLSQIFTINIDENKVVCSSQASQLFYEEDE